MPFLNEKENIGILFAISAFFCFSVLDVFQKYTVVYHSIFQILLIKYFFVLLLSLFESKRKNNNFFWKSQNIKFQILRSFLSLLESSCFVISFRYLSLADAHSVASLAPVLVVVLSVLLLRESVGINTWIAIFIGFIGVLIILRPGSSIFDVKSLIPLLGAFFLGLYQIATRKVSESDSDETSLFYTSLVGLLLLSVLTVIYWIPLTPISYFLFVGIGIFFSLGNYFQIIALSNARASIIQPFHYTLIFWAIIFGYFVYNDLPDFPTVLGACIISASGIYVIRSRI